MGEKFPKITTKSTDPRSSRNPKHKNMKKTTPKLVIIKLLKPSNKKNLKSSLR